MSGIFTQWQPIYAERGIATFPVQITLNERGGKIVKPAVGNWQKFGVRASNELVRRGRFNDHQAIALCGGEYSRVVVADVDQTEEAARDRVLAEFGDTPLVTRTARGKWHAYYKWSGERKTTIKLNGIPIDVQGPGAAVILPPSRILKSGSYSFYRGEPADLLRLPVAHGLPKAKDKAAPLILPDDVSAPVSAPLRGMRDGDGRNKGLFRAIGPIARQIHLAGGNRDQLLRTAQRHNAQCAEPMENSEVKQVVESVWEMTVDGHNFIGRPGAFVDISDMERMIANDQDALILLLFLRGHQGPHATFMCANGLGKRLGWGEDRVGRARRHLVERGYIKPVRHAGRGVPALFRWAYLY